MVKFCVPALVVLSLVSTVAPISGSQAIGDEVAWVQPPHQIAEGAAAVSAPEVRALVSNANAESEPAPGSNCVDDSDTGSNCADDSSSDSGSKDSSDSSAASNCVDGSSASASNCNDASTSTSSSGPVQDPTSTAPPTGVCHAKARESDVTNGVDIVTDLSCASGGTGCIGKVCRHCKHFDTPQSSSFVTCESITGIPEPTSTTPAPTPTTPAPPTCQAIASTGDQKAGVDLVTDLSCASGGIGCLGKVCRYCKRFESDKSKNFKTCESITGVTLPPTTTTPTSTSSGSTPSPSGVCQAVPSSGDQKAGVNIVTDTTCANGGIGCLGKVCRFCQVFETDKSKNFKTCVSITGVTDAPTTTVPSPATSVPTPTASGKCQTIASTGDQKAGVDIVTDTTCINGGIGCLGTVCRFCQVFETDKSKNFKSCASITGSAPPSTSPSPTSSTPAPTGVCQAVASSGDQKAGVDIVTDTTCANGGIGCLGKVCRFCQVFETDKSKNFKKCTTITTVSNSAATNFNAETATSGVATTQAVAAVAACVAATMAIAVFAVKKIRSNGKSTGLKTPTGTTDVAFQRRSSTFDL